MSLTITQTPKTGTHKLFFRGDTVTFKLSTTEKLEGRAFLRTNIGSAHVRRREIIENVEMKKSYSDQDWRDLPMVKLSDLEHEITLALIEVGHFEGKCCFLESNGDYFWPEGENSHINVEPADYCCANSVYCAFVRQFGVNKNKPASTPVTDVEDSDVRKLDYAGFSVIPPSGTFRDLIKELDHIVDKLRCRVLHLLPINPTPTVFARMGRYGSPYASLDFTGIDPALAVFDKKATPLDQFLELVDAVHCKNARIILDVAINHTGWAARIHETDPEWLVREDDGSIHSPGAWGVVWGDLTELDNKKPSLWKYLSDMFLVWCARGVDGFRCDAGYMVPLPAWEYIISRVKNEYPDTVFLLEGLGGAPAITLNLLDKANMNWAYSELFQNYTKEEIEPYLDYAFKVSSSDGLLIHYAETHDNSRLAAISEAHSSMRTVLCALSSANGAFGFANGVEWFAREKIDVHESSALNWGAPENQIKLISRLNSILVAHPAFHPGATLKFIKTSSIDIVAFIRSDSQDSNIILAAINMNCETDALLVIEKADMPFNFESTLFDLISQKTVKLAKVDNRAFSHAMRPGEFLCLSDSRDVLKNVDQCEENYLVSPDRIDIQRARAVVLSLVCSIQNSHVVYNKRIENLASKLLENPCECVKLIYERYVVPPIISWNWPEDHNRCVMLPPEHALIVKAPYRFRASVCDDNRILFQVDSLRSLNGQHFAIFPPFETPEFHKHLILRTTVYGDKKSFRDESPLLLLSPCETSLVKTSFTPKELAEDSLTIVAGNGRGGILRPSLSWANLFSRYDAILLANLSDKFPEDRHVMWRRCRIWVVYQGRTREFSLQTTDSFEKTEKGGVWKFRLPVGSGLHVNISVILSVVENSNAVRMFIYREPVEDKPHTIRDDSPVKIVVRPDIEDRNFHFETKAYAGPDKEWPSFVSTDIRTMLFKPAKERELLIRISRGSFTICPEWTYSVFQERESERGLEPNSDVFSPGFFQFEFCSCECVELLGQVLTPWESKKVDFFRRIPEEIGGKSKTPSIEDAMLSAMKQFIVRREPFKTVIAGYPWFLDWGRDTLICARGLIAAGMTNQVRDILLQFASFENNGTLPNMIHGGNASNIDTSDAPLWFIVACRDLCDYQGGRDFLETEVKPGRCVINVITSIIEGYLAGTVNGIKADPESLLVYSPSHYTWMDTNYPAGTPREGYPVEIQALWFAALSFAHSATGDAKWKKYADKTSETFRKYFWLEGKGFLSDCLHSSRGIPASKAAPDDHLRSNQLFAITMGLINDTPTRSSILNAAYSLLIPGAIRTLSPAPVNYPLPIEDKDGKLINNPFSPYWGTYYGDEDSQRKPAYHNGTAWTWTFPSFCEAYYMTYGNEGLKTAKSILSSSILLMNSGCIGQLPEILDGDFPHKQRGCDAQAWGITELYRVWKLLKK